MTEPRYMIPLYDPPDRPYSRADLANAVMAIPVSEMRERWECSCGRWYERKVDQCACAIGPHASIRRVLIADVTE